jgi:hypothetical protein
VRTLQIALFGAGAFSLIAAFAFIGDDTAEVLWHLSVALFLADIVCIKLWPGYRPA